MLPMIEAPGGGPPDAPENRYKIGDRYVSRETFDLCVAAWRDSDTTRRCKCGARIFWRVHHSRHTNNPIDADPVSTGNIVLMPGKQYRVVSPDQLKEPTPPGEIRFVSHFATCPNRAQFRKA